MRQKKQKNIKRILKLTFTGLVGLVCLLLVGFYLWALIPYTVMDEAQNLLSGDDYVKVSKDKDLVFKPASGMASNVGFILYPGTRVDSEAYAPLAYDIAKAGHTAVLAQMPLDLSVLDIDRASQIAKTHPNIKKWVIGGHSMGGAMAAFYTADNLHVIDGLVFLGSYPSENTHLADSGIEVISLYGEFDYVASVEEVMKKKTNLPLNTNFVQIDGGNHAGFGWYGSQGGDGEATITRAEQQCIVSDSIIELMDSLTD